MTSFTGVFDACVLYSAPLRDFLMQLALTDLFRAKWSDAIHDEWMRNILADRPDIKPEELQRTRQLMDSGVRDALVTGYEFLIPTLSLPDVSVHPPCRYPGSEAILAAISADETSALPGGSERLLPDKDDRHVLAAAIRCQASVIVTFNLQDFPKELLAQYHIEAIHPDDFISYLYHINAAKVLQAAATHRHRLTNPKKTVEEYLDTLLKQGLPQTVNLLREMATAI